MNDWQPIETAPKDGTEVILWYPRFRQSLRVGAYVVNEHYENGKLSRRSERWTGADGAFLMGEGHPEPTHWMPLPEPPAEETP